MGGSLQKRVISLRLRGKTYSEIAKITGVNIPKGTLSFWLKDLKIPEKYQERLNKTILLKTQKARTKAWETNKKNRLEFLKNLENKNLYLLKKINVETQKLLLCILYLAEGAKHKSTRFLSLGSSDPKIIQFYLALLKNCFSIQKSKFRIRIQCREDQEARKLEQFWSRITKVPIKQFYPTYFDKRTKGKPTLKVNYKGVCAIHYFDTSIQLELEILANSVVKFITKGP